MRRLDSLVIASADATAVPSGKALAVDRVLFSERIERVLLGQRGLRIVREECREIPGGAHVILATGPLTSAPLAAAIADLVGQQSLYFYDAIAPIVDASTIDRTKVFRASRYDAGEGDYLNCPLDEEQYRSFRLAVLGGGTSPQGPSRTSGTSRDASPSRSWPAAGKTPCGSAP